MLDNERLIYKMLLEQKLKLVTSARLYESSPVGVYEFPVIRFSERPFCENADAVLTQFPSDRTLASSWNTELVEKVFASAGEEAKKQDVYNGYFSCNDPKSANLSSSHFLSAQYLSAKNRGVRDKRPTAHRVVAATFGEELLRKNFTDTLLEEGAPDVLIAERVEDAELYLKNQEFHGLVYGVASSPEEAARYFFVGCAFVYLKEDFFTDLLNFIDVRIKNYRVAFGEYKENRLSMKELDRRAQILDIFDEGIINNACDRVINYLKKRKNAQIEFIAEKSALELKKEKQEEEGRCLLARKAARESIVLLKNQNFLPLKRGTKVALIGEYLENFDFQQENFSCNPTRKRLPIDVAKEYEELNVTGYAAGYRKGEGVNEELVSNAVRLASDADAAIVFLSAEPETKELPENQRLLVKALLGWNLKVVAVISADRCIDTKFANGCQAVLYTGRGGQEAAGAVFDLITGAYSPCGKLTEPSGGYPLGYGLTYTTFAYRDLEIDEGGVTLVVENKGNHDAFAIVQLYIQKDGSLYSYKCLKGFQKEFIKKGDAVRVRIPFTENTFRYYDAAKKKYRTQGGEYNLFVSESVLLDKLTGTVRIAADDGDKFTNTISETVANGAKVAFSESRGLEEKRGISFGMKLFLILSSFIYFNAVMAMLLFAGFIPVERTVIFYALTGSITGVMDGLLIFFIVFVCMKRKKAYVPVTDTLTDMLDQVGEFVEIAKLTYPDPVKEKIKAQKAQQEAEAFKEEKECAEREKNEEVCKAEQAKAAEKKKEEKSEKETAASKPVSRPSLDKPSDYPESNSFEKTYQSFRQYFMEQGINVGAGSARRLLAAIASSRLVLVTSKNQELLPEFMTALNNYFGGLGVSVAEDGWNTVEDLLWQQNAGRNMFSLFTNALNDASRRHNKNAVAVIGNVDSKNLPDWFAEIIDFAAAPTEEHKIVFNDDVKLTIPQNFCAILFAKENGMETELPRNVLNASFQIDISIRREAFTGEEKTAEKSISYPNMCALVREAREKFFLSEKNWRKIDELFDFVNANERLRFGNKNTLMAEKFTSVLMACGAAESEALTSLLRFKIVPFLKTSRLYEQEDGITVFSDYMQKLFPDEELVKVQKLLSERPQKAEEKAGNTFYTPDFKGEETASADEVSEPVYEEEAVEEVPTVESIFAETSAEEAQASEFVFEEREERPAEEQYFSGPVREEGTAEEAQASESDYEDDYDEEVPTLESIFAGEDVEESAEETVFERAADNTDFNGYGSEIPAYDASAYENLNDTYQNGDYNGGQGYQDDYGQNAYQENSYGNDGYGASDDEFGSYGSYGSYRDEYQNDGYGNYTNFPTDEWGNRGRGGNR